MYCRSIVHFIPCVALAILTTGCDGDRGPLQIRENAFSWSDHVPAGATLAVRDFNGEINVTPSRDDTVRVTARIEWHRGDPDESLLMSGSRIGSDALICAVWGTGECTIQDYSSDFKSKGSGTDAKVYFDVSVPAGVLLDLQGVNGSIVAASTAPVKARTMHGSITVVTAVGPVRAETLNGSVDIRMSSLVGTDSVIAKTLNGNAFVYLPDGVDAVIDLGVTSGTVSTEFPVSITGEPSSRSLRTTLGAGSRTVRVRTMKGNAALRRLDGEGRSYDQSRP